MVTTTRRGWWPALEPALLAFAVVVCGSVSALAQSRAMAIDGDHQWNPTGSTYWTATPTDRDSLDDRDDDDDGADSIVALPILLTSDDGFGRLLIQTEFDVALTLRSERLASRGPPDRPWKPRDSERHPQDSLLAFTVPSSGGAPLLAQPRASTIDSNDRARTSDSNHWTALSHDSVDDGDDDGDDDDDDGADDVVGTIAAPLILTTDDSGHSVNRAEFDVTPTLLWEQLASRGPPNWTWNPCPRQSQDSSDIDVTDDDDDDDSGEFDRLSLAGTCGPNRILILSKHIDLFSVASDNHSLRAPPQ